MKKTIDKWSAGYWFVKNIITKPAHLLYYRKIEIRNAQRIPDHESVILAPNHQNALMDAMVLVLHLKYQGIFLTRADIFKNPIIRRILFFLKMLPIYRIRDGRENMHKNDEIFDICVQILLNKKNPICMFPEGNHGEKRQLRPLKKGIFRIAFKAQEHFGNHPGVKIVPIGLDYENYYKFGKRLFVNVGHPIEVSEYWNAFQKDPEDTINTLRSRLKDEIKNLMINIESDEHYDLYRELCDLFRHRMITFLQLKPGKPSSRFEADKAIVEKLDNIPEDKRGKLLEIEKVCEKFVKRRNELNLRNWLFRQPSYPILLNSLQLIFLVVVSPLFFLGLILNAPVFFISPRYAKKIRDKQMRSTISWGIAFALGLVYYPLLIIAGLYLLPFMWLKIIFIPLIPASGLLAFRIRNAWIKAISRIRYTINIKKDPAYQQVYRQYSELIQQTESLTGKLSGI